MYRKDKSVSDGKLYSLATDYKIVRSPVEAFDFALIKLDNRAGDDMVGRRSRGFVTPTEHAFESQEPIFILQHPEAEPLKLAFGSATLSSEWPPNRITYQVNTSGGSSGSPIATQSLDVAGLHHWGSNKYNRGIPMSAILGFLRAHPDRDLFAQAGLSHVLDNP